VLKLGAPSAQSLLAVKVPPGVPAVYRVMIFPEVAVNDIASVTILPDDTDTGVKVNVVSPAAVAAASASCVPFTATVRCAVTLGSGSTWTSADDRLATPLLGTVNVCVAVPPGIDSGRPGLPRHMAWLALAGP
jgi:hypothetical protein